ncbi:hypothetical protein Tco_0620656, partial [Tanacetum coccineum]
SDTVKNSKLSTYPVLSARSYPTKDPQCSTQTHDSINAIIIYIEQQSASYDNREKENKKEKDNPENIHVNPPIPPDPSITFITKKVLKFNLFFESLRLVPPSSNTELIYTKEEDSDVMFIKIVSKDDNSRKEDPKQESKKWSILTYSRLGIPCNIGHVHVEKAYIDLNSPLNIMTRTMYNWIMRRKLNPRKDANRGVINFTGKIKGMHVFVGNFTYIMDFMIIEDISSEAGDGVTDYT